MPEILLEIWSWARQCFLYSNVSNRSARRYPSGKPACVTLNWVQSVFSLLSLVAWLRWSIAWPVWHRWERPGQCHFKLISCFMGPTDPEFLNRKKKKEIVILCDIGCSFTCTLQPSWHVAVKDVRYFGMVGHFCKTGWEDHCFFIGRWSKYNVTGKSSQSPTDIYWLYVWMCLDSYMPTDQPKINGRLSHRVANQFEVANQGEN